MIKIKIYGLGGQGVVTMGKILCAAYSIYENEYAKTMPAYGHERKGGTVLTDVISDYDRILTNSFITDPDFIVILDPNVRARDLKLDAEKYSDAAVIINTDKVKQEYADKFAECWYTDATRSSLTYMKKNIPNLGMMGALAKAGAISIDSVINAVSDYFGKDKEIYQKIIMEGYNGTKKR